LEKDPWPEILEQFPVGKIINGKVVKITTFGAFVALNEELEGLVFAGEMNAELMAKLKPGDGLKVKIIKIDPGSAKIGLSANIQESSESA
jgi:small subunit ribosomal protein S1